jgi:small subunit ribosomal protein S10
MPNQAKKFCSTLSQDSKVENLPMEATQKDKLYSRLEIELKGIEPEVMKSYAWYATTAAQHLGIQVGKW